MYVWSCMKNSTIHEFHSLPHARIVDIDKEVFLQNKEINELFHVNRNNSFYANQVTRQ